MCGIAGWINLSADLSEKAEIIKTMNNTLKHRGPDAAGVYISPSALIAHSRLAVIDLEGGKQPMIRSLGGKKFVITYNGELYNTQEVKDQLILLGHRFYTSSDTEVLLMSYIEWGSNCLSRLNGIFAFAVWCESESERHFFMARDRFGVKPLFYTIVDDSLIFGSELKALLANPLVPHEIDTTGLSEVFALGPARTPGCGVFKNIFELKPGYYMTHSKNGTKIQKYWGLTSTEHTDDFEATAAKVKELVWDSIERQLVSDVPVSTFLSGGLDSSAISAIAALDFAKSHRQLDTYSIDYIGNDLFFKPSSFQPDPDSAWISAISENFKTNHHYIKFDTHELFESLVAAMHARDLPGMADIDSSLLLFCREIKKNAVVALSGECADEIFGGYPWFHREEMINLSFFPWMMQVGEKLKVLSRELVETIQPMEYIKRRYHETLDEVPRLPGESILEMRRRELFYLNIVWFMATLLDRKDRMSMASGLEVRVPFCDHRLAQYVFNIPWEVKAHGQREKGLLRHVLRDLLPEGIVTRKKSPFPKTHNPAYENAVKAMLREIITDSGSKILPFLDVKKLSELLGSESDYGKPWFGQLMAAPQLYAYLIQVEFWLRDYNISIV